MHIFILLLSYFVALVSSGGSINRCVGNTDDIVKQPNNNRKWAIICLTKPSNPSIDQRNRNLASKLKSFSNNYQVDVIFFSETKIPAPEVKIWEQTFRDVAKVRVVDTSSRGFNAKERYGYKYMCKFFALDVYDYLKEYDYYMRCDTDCYIQQLSYDLFDWTEKSNLQYGYAVRKLEAHGPTKQTLPVWTQKYIDRCDIAARGLMDRPLKVCFNFYNNFHVGKVSFFLRSDVQHYLRSVNDSGHILSDRWGDSTIQAYAVRIFMEPQHIIMIPNFTYIHGSHSNRVVNTFGDGSLTDVPQMLPVWKYLGGNS